MTFGDESLDLILGPFIEELPEKDLGKKLNDVNEIRKKAAEQQNNFLTKWFGPKQKAVSTMTAPTIKATSKNISSLKKTSTTKSVGKYTKTKLGKEGIDGLSSSKRGYVNAKVRSFKANRIDAKTLISCLKNELGNERALSVLKDLAGQLPIDLAKQLNAATKLC